MKVTDEMVDRFLGWKLPEDFHPDNVEAYVDAGMAMARKIFEKRGNHSEVHLNEGELAGFLSIAISNGVSATTEQWHKIADERAAEIVRLLEREVSAISEKQPTKYILPPADANGKRPRLFYWEDAEDCWCPAEGLEVDNIISVDLFLSDGGIEEIRFKRQDMTDAEFDAIPEG